MTFELRKICALILAAAPLLAESLPKKVTNAEAQAAATNKVQPEYPPIARQLKLAGAVELEIVISEEGKVENVKIVTGNPVLTRPASDALQKWRFKPFMEDGKPVRVEAPFSFLFHQP